MAVGRQFSGHVSVMFLVGQTELPALFSKAVSESTTEGSGLSTPTEKSNFPTRRME